MTSMGDSIESAARDYCIVEMYRTHLKDEQEKAEMVQIIRTLSAEIVGLRNQLKVREAA